MQTLNNLPAAFEGFSNWVAWREELSPSGRLTKVPYQATDSFLRADPTNPQTWNRLASAVKKALLMGHGFGSKAGVGFVITRESGLVCIDLDDPNKLGPNAENAIKVHQEILLAFAGTYIERSPSGTGYHIWFRGELPDGRLSITLKDKAGIEIYSGERYMTVTGDVLDGATVITDQQPMLDKLIQLMVHINGGMLPGKAITANDTNEIATELGRRLDLTDEQVVQIAIRNNAKFLEFFNSTPPSDRSRFAKPVAGDLDKITASPEQILRIMAFSPIGQTYDFNELERKLLKYWLPECRESNREILEKREIGRQLQAELVEREKQKEIDRANNLEQSLDVAPEHDPQFTSSADLLAAFKHGPKRIRPFAEEYPPGMIGIMAAEIRDRATMRASKDFAIATALGLFAGLSGHAYSFERVNGALYMLLLGTSGQGKEAPAEARDVLVTQLRAVGVPKEMTGGLYGPGKITSPQGLHRRLETDKTLFCILGESTLWLRDLVSSNMGVNLEVKRFILDLYGKMGAGRVITPSEVLNKDNKLGVVMCPAATLLMEGEPRVYHELVGDEAYTSSGLCARIIHVEGNPSDMPEKNYGVTSFSEYVVGSLASMLPAWAEKRQTQTALVQAQQNGVSFGGVSKETAYIYATMTEGCLAHHRGFDRELDFFLRDSDPKISDVFNRVVPNILRVSLNLAAGVNPYNPVIDLPIYEWAQEYVLRGLSRLRLRIETGQTGTGDVKIRHLMLSKVEEWAAMPPSERLKILQRRTKISNQNCKTMSYVPLITWSVLQAMILPSAEHHVGKGRGTQAMRMMLNDMKEGGQLLIQQGYTADGVEIFGGILVGLAQ